MKNQKKKNHYYVLVMGDKGPVFVTGINYANKYASWNYKEKPLEMSETEAKDLTFGLNTNFNIAFMIKSQFEVESQPYMYTKGGFEWEWDEKE